uniref:Uncharacterized protein n=1 Tax=Setaria italica TaxID=4555 RepID=K3YXL3_SETIT
MLPQQSLEWKFAGSKMVLSLKTHLTLANPGHTGRIDSRMALLHCTMVICTVAILCE